MQNVGLDFWIFYVAFPIAMLAHAFTEELSKPWHEARS